jgi:endo-beta-N-acetylglucosaminidase D
VTCRGKDAEFWAGNFGTRFRRESLLLIHEGSSKPDRQIHMEESRISPLNYSCDFNYGYGQTYFINGE